MRPRHVFLMLLASFLFGAPTASAALIPQQTFEGEGAVIDLFGVATQEKGKIPDLFLFTGSAQAEGRDGGLFFFLNPTSAGISQARRVEVYDLSGDLDQIDRAEFQSTGRPIHQAFTNATVTISRNASFVIFNGDLIYRANENFVIETQGAKFNYSADAPFAFGLPVQPPKDLAPPEFELDAAAGLVMVGKDLTFAGAMRANASRSFLLLPTGDKGSVLVRSPQNQTGNFTVGKYAFLVYESARIAVNAPVLIVPFATNATAAFQPAKSAALKDAFDLAGLTSLTNAFRKGGDNATDQASFLPKQVTDNLNAISPLLNGALLRTVNGTVEVGGKPRELGNFTLIRYSTATLAADATGNSTFAGKARFVLVEDGFVTSKSVVNVGALPIPALSLVLWVLAAAAIAAGFLLRPFAAPQLPIFGMTRLLGWVFHGICLVIAFLLWDAEIKSFLGTSLLTIFAQGAFGQGVAFAIIGAFEIVPLLLAFGFFAYPVRFIINSGLKVAGLKKARGIGKGVGNLSAWLLGAPFIPAFLNLVVGAFLKAIQGAF